MHTYLHRGMHAPFCIFMKHFSGFTPHLLIFAFYVLVHAEAWKCIHVGMGSGNVCMYA